jgi:hypothetical protein
MSLVLARFAALDQARDPYLVEHHHARKKDAPSGTARLLTKVIMKGCPRKTEWTLQGPGELKEHQLSVSAIRAGHTYSSHTVDDAPRKPRIHHASVGHGLGRRAARRLVVDAKACSPWTSFQSSRSPFREVNLS